VTPGRPLRSGHLADLGRGLAALDAEVARLERWGRQAADVMLDGGRLLAAGNGGSAAEAQHLTGELVGRFRDERRPLSAISLHADTSTLTAVGNDYGLAETFRRGVLAHGRPGDVLLALSTSGCSTNVILAVEAANEIGITTLALIGPDPCPLLDLADDAVQVTGPSVATVQELHLVCVHLLCAAVDRRVAEREGAARPAAIAPAGPGR
jgi:D-sedoheptulose 7-phosphate isomerase